MSNINTINNTSNSGISRIQEAMSFVPIITLIILFINILVHVIIFLFSINLSNVAISYQLVIVKGEFYRIVSAAFVHAGIMHIFMNMSSLIQLGVTLERQMGSLQYFIFTAWSVILVGGLYLVLCW